MFDIVVHIPLMHRHETLTVEREYSIATIKGMLQATTDIRVSWQTLQLTRGTSKTILANEKTLEFYNIEADTELDMLDGLHGGAPKVLTKKDMNLRKVAVLKGLAATKPMSDSLMRSACEAAHQMKSGGPLSYDNVLEMMSVDQVEQAIVFVKSSKMHSDKKFELMYAYTPLAVAVQTAIDFFQSALEGYQAAVADATLIHFTLPSGALRSSDLLVELQTQLRLKLKAVANTSGGGGGSASVSEGASLALIPDGSEMTD
jgi:hypothetical protein